MKYANFWERTRAFMIDGIILIGVYGIAFLTILFVMMISNYTQETALYDAYTWSTASYVIAFFSYFTWATGKNGDTIGKRYCGLKVVTNDGKKPTMKRAFGRSLSYMVSSVPFDIGFFWVAVDKKRQGFHDKLAKTYVVKK
jgi:uncharacterized RDD family membrane protein YckC